MAMPVVKALNVICLSREAQLDIHGANLKTYHLIFEDYTDKRFKSGNGTKLELEFKVFKVGLEHPMHFRYQTIGGPVLIQHADSNWTVHSLELHQSTVESRLESDLNLCPGLLLTLIFKFQVGWIGSQVIEELKYYVEQSQSYPQS